MRERLVLDLDKLKGLIETNDSIISSKRYKRIIVEWIILSIHPYSFLLGGKVELFNKEVAGTIYYNYNDYLALLSVFRNIYALKLVLNMSVWKSSSAERVW